MNRCNLIPIKFIINEINSGNSFSTVVIILRMHNSTQSGSEDNIIPLKLVGEVTPKHSSEISNSPFGIQAGTLVDSLVERESFNITD